MKIIIKTKFFKLINIVKIKKKSFAIVSSGLSIFSLFKLKMFLGGDVLIDPIFPENSQKTARIEERKWTIASFKDDSEFERLAKEIIPIWIPTNFIEGFQGIKNELKQSKSLSSKRDVIFSSNFHFFHDIFKIWAAELIDNDTSLVIGQHGGGPFNRYNAGTKYEIDLADFYLTTGFGNTGYTKLRVLGQYFTKFKKEAWDKNGKALLVTANMPRYVFEIRSMPLANQLIKYFNDQLTFYEKLEANIRSQTIVRLYSPEDNDYGWNVSEKWKTLYPNVILESPFKPLSKSARNCRLFVSTYNATTFNEALAANIPTVIYWDESLWEAADFAVKDFETLKDVGIFHETSLSAAQHVNKVWSDLSGWWYRLDVQDARKNFCYKYALREKGMERRLANILKEVTNDVNA